MSRSTGTDLRYINIGEITPNEHFPVNIDGVRYVFSQMWANGLPSVLDLAYRNESHLLKSWFPQLIKHFQNYHRFNEAHMFLPMLIIVQWFHISVPNHPIYYYGYISIDIEIECHYSHVAWAYWRPHYRLLKCLLNDSFNRTTTKNSTAPQYWPFFRRTHGWPTDSLHKGRKRLHNDVIKVSSSNSYETTG